PLLRRTGGFVREMMKHWTFSTAILTVCAALILSACTKDPTVLKQRHLEKAQAYFAKQQYNEAVIELKNALQIDPNFAPAVYLAGRAYLAKRWYVDALQQLRRAVELQPDNLAARVDLARASAAIEVWDDTLREAETVLSKAPSNSAALY